MCWAALVPAIFLVTGIICTPRRSCSLNVITTERGKQEMSKRIIQHDSDDGINRRGFLECMAWSGTGVVWAIAGGIPTSRAFGQPSKVDHSEGALTFVQISDSHIGFNKPANPDVN